MEAIRERTAEGDHLVRTIHGIRPWSSRDEINAALDLLYDDPEDPGRTRMAQMGRVYIGRQAMTNDAGWRNTRDGLEPMSIVDTYIPSLDERSWTPARYLGAAYLPARDQRYWRDRLYQIPRFFGETQGERYEQLRASALFTGAPLASDLYPELVQCPKDAWITISKEEIPVTTSHEKRALRACQDHQCNVRELLQSILINASETVTEIQASWFRIFSTRKEMNLVLMIQEAQRSIRLADAARTETELQVYGRALGEFADEHEACPASVRESFAPIHEAVIQIRMAAIRMLPKRDTDIWRS